MPSDIIDTLDLHQSMKVIGNFANMYRVLLPNGSIGYLEEALTEALELPIENQPISESYALHRSPIIRTMTNEKLMAGDTLSLLARHEAYWLVRNSHGKEGWIEFLND